jgi:hypothetical protein
MWINSALTGLERVNPFVAELENLNVYDDEDDIALHLQYSNAGPNSGIAAIMSLAPASFPTRRKSVIQRKGANAPIFLDLFSPFVEPPLPPFPSTQGPQRDLARPAVWVDWAEEQIRFRSRQKCQWCERRGSIIEVSASRWLVSSPLTGSAVGIK